MERIVFSSADKAVQENLSIHARRFLEHVERNPRLLERETFEPFFDASLKLLTQCPGREVEDRYGLQPWPVLLSAARQRELERAAVELGELLRLTPELMFGEDPRAVKRFYGLESDLVASLLLSEPTGFDAAFARGDFLDTRDGLKCMEFNFGNLGGWQEIAYAPAYLQNPELAAFLAEQKISLSFKNSIRELLRFVVSDCLASPLGEDNEVNVLIVASESGDSTMETHPRELYQRELEAVLAEVGGGLRAVLAVAMTSELECRNQEVRVWGRRFHAVIEQNDQPTSPELFRAFKSGSVKLYGSAIIGRILTNKRNLALLSEHAESDLFTDEERQLIQRYVPWTRRVDADETIYQGEKLPLVELLRSHRQGLVLKAGQSSAGIDVHVGKFLDRERWQALVETARKEGGWVVQEYLEPLPYTFQAEEAGAVPHNVAWGLLVFGDEYGGNFVRMAPCDKGAVVNLARGARTGLCFEVVAQA